MKELKEFIKRKQLAVDENIKDLQKQISFSGCLTRIRCYNKDISFHLGERKAYNEILEQTTGRKQNINNKTE